MVRILAIILNVSLIIFAILCLMRYPLDDLWPDEPFVFFVILLSLVVPVVNCFASPLFFEQHWIRSRIKSKTLEEQVKLVEQAEIHAQKKASRTK